MSRELKSPTLNLYGDFCQEWPQGLRIDFVHFVQVGLYILRIVESLYSNPKVWSWFPFLRETRRKILAERKKKVDQRTSFPPNLFLASSSPLFFVCVSCRRKKVWSHLQRGGFITIWKVFEVDGSQKKLLKKSAPICWLALRLPPQNRQTSETCTQDPWDKPPPLSLRSSFSLYLRSPRRRPNNVRCQSKRQLFNWKKAPLFHIITRELLTNAFWCQKNRLLQSSGWSGGSFFLSMKVAAHVVKLIDARIRFRIGKKTYIPWSTMCFQPRAFCPKK